MTNNNFLPKEYKDNQTLNDSSQNYMKFVKGENRFRIMSSPIVGWEYWIKTEDGKKLPKRFKIDEKIDISTLEDPDSLKRFWAMIVYNYNIKKLQILQITQKGIQKTLENLARDEDWGSPVQKYDIIVTRSGDGLETEYEVLPKPATKMDEELLTYYKHLDIDLNALYEGKDPFKKEITLTEMEEMEKNIS